MNNIEKEDTGKAISLITFEKVMRDQIPKTIIIEDYNIIVNLHPTDVIHWVLVIKRGTTRTYYLDNFGVETLPLFLQQ